MDQDEPAQPRDHRAVIDDILDRLAAMQPGAAWAEEWTERVLAVRLEGDEARYVVQERTAATAGTAGPAGARDGWLDGAWLDLVLELRRRMVDEGRDPWRGVRFALAEDGSAQVGFDRGEEATP